MATRTTRFVAILVFASIADGAAAIDLTPGPGVTFLQIDWTYPGAPQTFSRTGLAVIDYALLPPIGSPTGYVNVMSGGGAWLLQNVPVDLTSGLPGVTAMLDLGSTGPKPSFFVNVQYTVLPLNPPVLGAVFDHAPAGMGTTPFDPDGLNLPRVGIANPPPVGAIVFPGGVTFNDFLPNFAFSVETHINQCAPVALANSLQYLEDRFASNVVHENVPGENGAPANSLAGQLDLRMNRLPNQPTPVLDFLTGKLDYLGDFLDLEILVVKHQGGPPGDLTVNGVTSFHSGPVPTDVFLLAECQVGKDIELGIDWDPPDTGGHMVRVVGCGRVLGVPWIAFVHDANQANLAAGTGLAGGGVGFSWLQDTDFDGLLNFHNFIDGTRGEVDFLVTEAPPIEPLGGDLPALGPGGLLALLVALAGAGAFFVRRHCPA